MINRTLKIILVIFFITFIQSNNVFSQGETTNKSNAKPVSFMSPEAANLGKYGTYEVNYSTGTPNINIPIYTIDAKGIKIPISINYDASGLIPNKGAGVVGMNWSLKAGGAITRVVQGVPDEEFNPNPNQNPDLYKLDKGYIYGMQKLGPPNYTQAQLLNLEFMTMTTYGSAYLNQVPVPTGLSYELAPDIFSFNFLGHSGTFFMGNDGNVRVSSNRNYKVDLTEFLGQDGMGINSQESLVSTNTIITKLNSLTASNINTYNFSRIKMIADDGYQFYFGGTFNNLEVSFSFTGAGNRDVVPFSGLINAWYLYKVVSPEGTEIIFDNGTYSTSSSTSDVHDYELNVLKNLTSPSGAWDNAKANFMDIKLYDYENFIRFTKSDGSQSIPSSGLAGNDYSKLKKNLIKQVYLKRIITPLITVNFDYMVNNETAYKFYGDVVEYGTISKNDNYHTKRLYRINIVDNLQIGRAITSSDPTDPDILTTAPSINYEFDYNFVGSSSVGYRYFLKSITNLGADFTNIIKYQFDYKRLSELPHPLTGGIDLAGYYNGYINNTSIIGQYANTHVNNFNTPSELENDFTQIGSNRTTNPSVANIGMLEKIIFPTGGTAEFEFESHDYGKVLKKKLTAPLTPSHIGSMIPVIENENGYTGGVRIKSITTNPGTTIYYKYVVDFENNQNGSSSGVFVKQGPRRLDLCGDPTINSYYESIGDNTVTKATGYAESPVQYSEVEEYSGSLANGFMKYLYSTNVTNPNDYFLGANTVKVNTAEPAYINSTNFKNQLDRMYKESNRCIERGKLLQKQVFNASATTPFYTEEYFYNTNANRTNDKTIGYDFMFWYQWPWGYNGVTYYCNAYQMYHYQNEISKVVKKTRNINTGQVITETTDMEYWSSSNPALKSKTTTSSDGISTKTEYYYPQQITPATTILTDMINRNMTSKLCVEKTYKGVNLLSTNKQNYDYFGSNTSNFNIFLSNLVNINNTVAPPVEQESISFSNYDLNGNIIEYTKSKGYKTSYMWSYKQSFPVAEIFNASINDVAYTSFEVNTEKGGWIYDPAATQVMSQTITGNKIFNLSYNNGSGISKSANLAASKNYILSLWLKSGGAVVVNNLTPTEEFTLNGWTYKEYFLSGATNAAVQISGTGIIDELRLYPKGAEMTTYTYEPLFGITSTSSANNKLSYYQYDAYGRLINIKDQNKNILKQYCYNYFGQQESCPFYNATISITLRRNNCGPNLEGTLVTYTVPAGKYSSNVSQADADSQAQADLAANAQSYANTHGSCITSSNCPKKVYTAWTFYKGNYTCTYHYNYCDCSIGPDQTEVLTYQPVLTDDCL